MHHKLRVVYDNVRTTCSFHHAARYYSACRVSVFFSPGAGIDKRNMQRSRAPVAAVAFGFAAQHRLPIIDIESAT